VTEVEVGDVVLARGTTGRWYAVVQGVRLGRLVVERCDGRPAGPLSVRDVVRVFKDAGPPAGPPPAQERVRPTGQLRLELEAEPEDDEG
jgi:hypothetical protein